MTNLRYAGGVIPYVEAEYYIKHVTAINEWAERGE
jgi:hypothetical protein